MKITLNKLSIKNFKGILDREILFNGDTDIYGANESGKSTIYTAFNWLLTGKDVFDRADYEIKNTVKKEMNSQSHEVEAVIETDDNGVVFEHKLKRVYLEKWVRQRGASQKTFEGHKTEFWHNDVPCNKSEFEAKVNTIIDSKLLKLITNPNYFTSLKWDEQRRGLLSIAGEITHGDILTTIVTPENTFEGLTKVLVSGKSIDEYKKELSSKKSLLKKKALEYGPRIDEAKTNMPEASDWKKIEKQVTAKSEEVKNVERQLFDSVAALTEKQKGLIDTQNILHGKTSELESLKRGIEREIRSKFSLVDLEIQAAEAQVASGQQLISIHEKNLENGERNKADYLKRIEELDGRIAQARKDWDAANSQVFEFDETTCNCPTCKQTLPAHDIEYKKEEMRKNFNDTVTKKKADIVAQSNLLKSEKVQLEEKISMVEKQESTSTYELKEKHTALKAKLQELKDGRKPDEEVDADIQAAISSDAKATELSSSITTLTERIEEEKNKLGSDDNSELKTKKLHLTIELDNLKKQLAIKDVIEKTEQRIIQLENEESANAQEISSIEGLEFEIETYLKAKMSILEDRVNGMFSYVTWRLFDTQVNGAVVETCVCEYKGVPYPTVNTAGQWIAGIDIVNTLSNHYNIHAPVFCDNRESVSWIPKSESQIINLFVSAADNQLRIETKISESVIA